MKSSFALPSCTYTINLSKEELQQLLETGLVSSVRPIQSVPCSTSRAIFDNENKIFKPLDRKQIPNNLRFTLDENVADIEGGDWHVQFLNIMIEGFKNRNYAEFAREVFDMLMLFCDDDDQISIKRCELEVNMKSILEEYS